MLIYHSKGGQGPGDLSSWISWVGKWSHGHPFFFFFFNPISFKSLQFWTAFLYSRRNWDGL